VKNQQPIVSARGVNSRPPVDQYFKGALFLNTLRSVVNDDPRWWALLHGYYQHFKYQNIMTEDVVRYFNQQTGIDLTPVFDQYLRHAALPVLDLQFETGGSVRPVLHGGLQAVRRPALYYGACVLSSSPRFAP
jgi:aminopeptidase N